MDRQLMEIGEGGGDLGYAVDIEADDDDDGCVSYEISKCCSDNFVFLFEGKFQSCIVGLTDCINLSLIIRYINFSLYLYHTSMFSGHTATSRKDSQPLLTHLTSEAHVLHLDLVIKAFRGVVVVHKMACVCVCVCV